MWSRFSRVPGAASNSLGKAREKGLRICTCTICASTSDRHRTVDDTPYGGGAGMAMKAEPLGEVLAASPLNASEDLLRVPSLRTRRRYPPVADYPRPRRVPFDQARRMSWRRSTYCLRSGRATRALMSVCWTGRRSFRVMPRVPGRFMCLRW